MESEKPRLAIALCTRDRPDELLRASLSISRSCSEAGLEGVCALVVDAGQLDDDVRLRVLSLLQTAAKRVEYIHVKGRVRSLYESRLLSLRRARELGATHVAFFDDDVELLPGYMARLALQLEQMGPAMIGGVDADLRTPGLAKRAWARLSGTSSGEPGLLSGSGFSGSVTLWLGQSDPFLSEYVSGCNMIMDVRVVDQTGPEAAAVFKTYSMGEDLYFAACASRLGTVLIDPELRVRHHFSPRSRESRMEEARQLMVNMAWIARETGRNRLLFGWSIFWLAVRGLLEDLRMRQVRGSTLGMLRAAPDAARFLIGR